MPNFIGFIHSSSASTLIIKGFNTDVYNHIDVIENTQSELMIWCVWWFSASSSSSGGLTDDGGDGGDGDDHAVDDDEGDGGDNPMDE
jgi:hypothetical protein